MKFFNFFLFLALVSMFFSCSSDDSSSSSVPEGFTLIIDGETINVTSVQAYRFDNWMEVAGYGSNGKSIDFKFSTAGSLYDAFVFSIDSENPFGPKSTFEYYNENTFNFDLVSYDANTRRVSVNFSGKVYDDEYEDDCVIQKKHFVYLPSVKFMGAFNMRMMMSMVDAQYN